MEIMEELSSGAHDIASSSSTSSSLCCKDLGGKNDTLPVSSQQAQFQSHISNQNASNLDDQFFKQLSQNNIDSGVCDPVLKSSVFDSQSQLYTIEDAQVRKITVTHQTQVSESDKLNTDDARGGHCDDNVIMHKMELQQHLSPEKNGQYKYQSPSRDGDIRHQLLVQRTFNAQEDHHEPRTSSPLRKTRIMATSVIQTKTVSPSSGSQDSVNKNLDVVPKVQSTISKNQSPFLLSPTDNAQDGQSSIFKTPNRNQCSNYEVGMETRTPSQCCGTPLALSPASSYGFTPGRQFVNPFEIEHDRMHKPFFSPNMFKVTSATKGTKIEKEAFWSVEHSALIKPVDIKEAEIHRQHRYQQKIDREKEQDIRLQTAINKFFSNELIVPSPWSEKVKHVLPRTPGVIRSVSCQTNLSVPPNVDLVAELQGKYQLPDFQTEPSPFNDSMGNSFIRRKLLNQLNENDSELFGSPSLPSRAMEEVSSSPSPGQKQTTPEWEKQTPSKMGQAHFSSSPIRQGPDERGHHYALSESDLLASPELSPIARRASKSIRSSGIFCPVDGEDNPRAIMQLDFSSILDDPDDGDDDKVGTLIQKGSVSHLPMDSSTQMNDLAHSCSHPYGTVNGSQDSEGISGANKSGSQSRQAFLTSALSSESANDMASSAPQSLSNQDTGYQTASLQSTNPDLASSSNLTSHDGGPLVSLEFHPLQSRLIPNSSPTLDLLQPKEPLLHSNVTEEFRNLRYSSDRSSDTDGSFLGLAFGSSKEKSSSADDVMFPVREERQRVRKIKTLSDIRFSKERSSVSRDLTRSFNEEMEKSDSNMALQNSWSNTSPTSFTPVISQMAGQSSPDLQRYSSSPSQHDRPTISFTGLLKKASDQDGRDNNSFDISMRSASPLLNSSWDRKGLNLSDDTSAKSLSGKHIANSRALGQSSEIDHSLEVEQCVPRFALGDDHTLKQARLLLGKSEEFRQKLSQPKFLESDSLYQAFTEGVENLDPEILQCQVSQGKEIDYRPETPDFDINPVDSSTPSRNGNMEKKMEAEEGTKLGSEIAAEILKRAGEDLAVLADMLENK